MLEPGTGSHAKPTVAAVRLAGAAAENKTSNAMVALDGIIDAPFGRYRQGKGGADLGLNGSLYCSVRCG
jgi:hypothetical protein